MDNYQLEIKEPQERQTGCRSLLYSLLSRGFRFPQPALYESVKGGGFSDEVQVALTNLPYNGLKAGGLGRGLGLSYEEFQSNYLGLFEVGGNNGSPSHLYEGEYGGGRMKVLEEVLRFYHHFGLRLSTEKRDRPDHLSTELEFMHLLTFKETEALAHGKVRSAYLSAEREFLRFHVRDLVGAVAQRTGAKAAPFYQDLVSLADSFCQKDLEYLLPTGKEGGQSG